MTLLDGRRDLKTARLAAHPLLASLRRGDLRLLAAVADPVDAPAGAWLLSTDTAPRHCYLLTEGQLVTVDGVVPASAVFLGLHACWSGSRPERAVFAATRVRGFVLDARYVEHLVSRNPELLLHRQP